MKKTIFVTALASLALLGGSAATAASWSAAGGQGTFLVGPGGGNDYATLSDFFKDATGIWEPVGTVTSVGTVVTGTGTTFTTEGLVAGDQILASTGAFRGNTQLLTIVSVDSDTQITIAVAPSAALSGKINFRKAAAPTAISGNVLVSITGNLTEPANIGVVLTTGANTVTIKPAIGVSPTVSFTSPVDQTGFSSHFIIGTITCAANAVRVGTNNFIIDGSNAIAGTTRDMTWTTSVTYSSAGLLHLTGDVDNCVIKNTIFVNNDASAGSNLNCLRFTSVQYATGTTDFTSAGFAPGGVTAGTFYTPDNWTVQNCSLTTTAATQGHGILNTVQGTAFAGAAQSGFAIRGNTINARIRGIFVNNGYGYTVENNVINVGTTAAVNGTDTWGLLNNNSNAPSVPYTTIVRNNTFNINNASAAANIQAPTGISLGSLGAGYDRVVEVYNNSIILSNAGVRNAGVNANIRGISVSSGVTSRIYNNSISIPDNAATTNTVTGVASFGIGGYGAATHNTDIRNNIISVGEANIPAISQNLVASGVGSGFLSDYNTIFVSGGALVGRVVSTTYATLPLWQAVVNAGSSYDVNSDIADPTSFWTSDLHLNAVPGIADEWGGTPLATVTTDRDGDARSGTFPYRGSDELATALVASVADWSMISE